MFRTILLLLILLGMTQLAVAKNVGVPIPGSFKTCVQDDDCIRVMTVCDPCSSSVNELGAINKEKRDAYQTLIEAECVDIYHPETPQPLICQHNVAFCGDLKCVAGACEYDAKACDPVADVPSSPQTFHQTVHVGGDN